MDDLIHTNHHDQVVAVIRSTLPEFASRNGLEMSEKQMDNLAHWVAGVVPPNVARRECGANAIGIPCACTGACKAWFVAEHVRDRV